MRPGRVADGTLRPEQREQIVCLALRIYRGRFAHQVRAAGLDEDDAAQDVVVGVLSRLKGWQAGRGAPLEWWVGRSVQCAILNLLQRERRPMRSPPGGVCSLTIDGAEQDIEGGILPLTRAWLEGALEGADMEALLEAGVL